MDLEKDLNDPFITVVSVDGGLRCGNKLTVITPTEISEPIDSLNKPKTGIPIPSSSKASNIPLQSSSKSKPSSAIPTLVGVDRKVPTSGIPPPSFSTGQLKSPSGSFASQCASFVTVVALSVEKAGECTQTSSKAVIKSGIPVIKPQ